MVSLPLRQEFKFRLHPHFLHNQAAQLQNRYFFVVADIIDLIFGAAVCQVNRAAYVIRYIAKGPHMRPVPVDRQRIFAPFQAADKLRDHLPVFCPDHARPVYVKQAQDDPVHAGLFRQQLDIKLADQLGSGIAVADMGCYYIGDVGFFGRQRKRFSVYFRRRRIDDFGMEPRIGLFCRTYCLHQVIGCVCVDFQYFCRDIVKILCPVNGCIVKNIRRTLF